MSMAKVERALAHLRAPEALLAPLAAGGGYGVFPTGDRRRRPVVRLGSDDVRALEADGAIVRRGAHFVLSDAGGSRAARDAALPAERFLAQHAPVIDRDTIGADGAAMRLRAVDAGGALRRLATLRGPKGEPWLTDAELAAAARLRNDWAVGEIGLVRGSDWRAPPMGKSPRAVNASELKVTAQCDARRRVADALDALAPPLRRVVEAVCLREQGLEAFEREADLPARSGKLALKMGLAQLAAAQSRR